MRYHLNFIITKQTHSLVRVCTQLCLYACDLDSRYSYSELTLALTHSLIPPLSQERQGGRS
jgi:hypothetical protein